MEGGKAAAWSVPNSSVYVVGYTLSPALNLLLEKCECDAADVFSGKIGGKSIDCGLFHSRFCMGACLFSVPFLGNGLAVPLERKLKSSKPTLWSWDLPVILPFWCLVVLEMCGKRVGSTSS